MVRRVIWTPLASQIFHCVLLYYRRKTGSKSFSAKLNEKIQKDIRLLERHPFLGKPTEFDKIRVLSEGNYRIIYQANEKDIVILMIWDNRQNPNELDISSLL